MPTITIRLLESYHGFLALAKDEYDCATGCEFGWNHPVNWGTIPDEAIEALIDERKSRHY